MITQETVRASMEKLGVYKPEFDPIIEVYCQLNEQYAILTKQFVDQGCPAVVDTSSGARKNPLLTSIEGLRKDILNYATHMGLTPHGLKKLNEQAMIQTKKQSVIADALRELE